MIKNILFTALITVSLGTVQSVQGQKSKTAATTSKSDVKFLDISVDVPVAETKSDPKAAFREVQFLNKKEPVAVDVSNTATVIENASELQLKYALLLDMEVEEVRNVSMFKVIDDWFGTKYRLGGTTKSGIDCSALMQTFYTSLYNMTIPRTAREQYYFSKKISRTEIREGDLVFFNTIGGISHVGMYLQNNKFVHASKNGVTISDLYEDYWLKHFIGAGRIENLQLTAVNTKP
ncbi:MAG: C40 family peptidase [Flavisolibacter sp.]